MAFLWVSSRLRDTKDYVLYKIENTSEYVSDKGSKVFNAATGKATFLEADALYKKIENEYSRENICYKRRINEIGKEIENKIYKINDYKKDIYLQHFKRFKDLGDKLHNIFISGKHFLEYFDYSIIKLNNQNATRYKEDIYKIDFNNLKFDETTFGVLTFGFYTRKKAKMTLFDVKEEEKRVNEEIQKMRTQIIKAESTLHSISNILEYFTEIIKNYSKILDRFEYGIKSQIQKNILKGNKLNNGKLNFKMMPIIHIEEFHSLFNLSIVLKQMASLSYITESGEINSEDIKSFEKVKLLVNNNIAA